MKTSQIDARITVRGINYASDKTVGYITDKIREALSGISGIRVGFEIWDLDVDLRAKAAAAEAAVDAGQLG